MKYSTCVFLITCFVCRTVIAQTPSIKEQSIVKTDVTETNQNTKIELHNFLDSQSEIKPKTLEESLDWGKMRKEPAVYLKLFRRHLYGVKTDLKKQQLEVLKTSYGRTEIDSMVDIISKLKIERDKTRKIISKLNAINSNSKKLFPTLTKNEDFYNSFYKTLYDKNRDDNLYLVNNTSYQFNQGGVIRSELLSAYLKGVRISLGTVVTTQNTDEEETEDASGQGSEEMAVALNTDETEAFKRLTAGGSTYLDLEVPVALAQSESWTLYWNLNARMSYNIEGFSSDLKNTLFNSSVGTRFYSSISSDNKEFVFYATVSGGFYFGEEKFYNSLSIPTKGFLFGQIQLGVSVLQNLKLTFDINTFSTEDSLRSGRVVVGAQLLTDFFKKK